MSIPLPHPDLPKIAACICVAIGFSVALEGGGVAHGQAPAGERPPRIVPVDESPGHPAFHRFWRDFQKAVDERDGKFVLSVVSETIKLDFGGGEGREEFISTWKPNDPESSLWKELGAIVRLGGILEEEGDRMMFTTPYAFAGWPEKYDAFEYVFISGRNVRFRERPDPSSAIIRELSWEIMKPEAEKEGENPSVGDWTRLKAHDGRIGFVHNDYVRSSIDFRIGFGEDEKGGFVMEFFIAGD